MNDLAKPVDLKVAQTTGIEELRPHLAQIKKLAAEWMTELNNQISGSPFANIWDASMPTTSIQDHSIKNLAARMVYAQFENSPDYKAVINANVESRNQASATYFEVGEVTVAVTPRNLAQMPEGLR